MARMIKVDKNEAREKYAYFAYPKKLDRTLQHMVTADAGKYGIENVKDLIKNILMEAVVYYEKKHRYIEAKEWAAANWQKNRFSDLSASNVDDKLKTDYNKILAEEERHLQEQLERINRIRQKIPD
jgi:hypothetical protein